MPDYSSRIAGLLTCGFSGPRMLRSRPCVPQNAESFLGLWRGEMGGYRVKSRIADETPIDAGRFLLVPSVDIGKTLGIDRLDGVQDMIGRCRLEDGANPLPALERVAGKIEDDGDAEPQQFARERSDQVAAPGRGPREILERPDLEAERVNPLILAEHHGRQRSPSSRASVVFPAPALPQMKCSVAMGAIVTFGAELRAFPKPPGRTRPVC